MRSLQGASYYLRGITNLLRRPQLWRYVILPTIVSGIVFILVGTIGVWAYYRIIPKNFIMRNFQDFLYFTKGMTLVLSFVGTTGVYFLLTNLINDAYMTTLARQVAQNYKVKTPARTQFGLAKNFSEIVKTIYYSLRLFVLIIFVNVIPVVGQIITFLILSYISATSSVDYILSELNYDHQTKRKLYKENKSLLVGFGMICSITWFIPPFTFLNRSISVIGGTALAVEKLTKS